MLQLLIVVGRALALGLRGHRELVLENLALRQQLMAMKRANSRPRLQARDQLFWIALRRIWTNWRMAVVLCDQRPSWAGIARGSAGDGPYAQHLERTAVRPSLERSAPSSVRWPPRIRCGERPGYTASCVPSVSTCPNAPCRVC